MDKQLQEFEALVPGNFTGLMIQHWMKEESLTRDKAIEYYMTDEFKAFSQRVANRVCKFKPDIGYPDKTQDGLCCFEVEDNNYLIPVSILETAKDDCWTPQYGEACECPACGGFNE